MAMMNISDILETIAMIEEEHLDIRTITMGISLLDCCDSDIKRSCDKIYDKITRRAEKLVATGEQIEKEYGIPIINKRISVTPIGLISNTDVDGCVKIAQTLERAANSVGVNFIGGFSALVHKGYTESEKKLIESIPYALHATSKVCSSVNVGTTKAGINMDAVRDMGILIKKAAELSADTGGSDCARYIPTAWCRIMFTPILWRRSLILPSV